MYSNYSMKTKTHNYFLQVRLYKNLLKVDKTVEVPNFSVSLKFLEGFLLREESLHNVRIKQHILALCGPLVSLHSSCVLWEIRNGGN